MATLILRDQDIQTEMQRPWVKGQVDRHLSNMLYWLNNGYEFTEQQKEQLCWLCDAVEKQTED